MLVTPLILATPLILVTPLLSPYFSLPVAAAGAVDRELLYIELGALFPTTITIITTTTNTTNIIIFIMSSKSKRESQSKSENSRSRDEKYPVFIKSPSNKQRY